MCESRGARVRAELAFSVGDLAQMRFSVSPMWEVGPGLRLLRSGRDHPVHRRWTAQVRPRLAAAGLDQGRLAELVPPTGYVPDFLNPAPAGPAPTLEEELAAIRATPLGRIRAELDRLAGEQGSLGPRLRALHDGRDDALSALTEEIAAYWEVALAPYWARIRAVLEADVFHRTRQVAEHGAGRLFNDLHSSVSWGDSTLRLSGRHRPLSRRGAGPGLLLIPSVFTGPVPFTRVTPPDPPQLAYPARGTGTLWEVRRADGGNNALAAVLGRSRALLLAELESPATTAELARRTALSAPAVSQFLGALRGAGLVSAHRAGRCVLYARTAAAETLLAASAASAASASAATQTSRGGA
ncbi:ArsR family transcriptional regulator [Streptomyces sp. NPDC051815]|uniref:ArsR/SmtB family transcription factor n=1 Tax=Streptomyces sp. NPDC051815 TaxID=3365674 RepID=UPI0037981FD6